MRTLWIPCLAAIFIGAAFSADSPKNDFKPKKFDWPQWQGPNRDAKSQETGLLKEWPKKGPDVLWTAKKLGGGFSTPAVSAGRVFGLGFQGDDEIAWALDDETGKELWSKRIAAHKKVQFDGPRSTPTIDGDRLYAIGVGGELVCMDVENGKIVWHKSLKDDFGGEMMSMWGFSESPLVDGDLVLCTPGGANTVVALDKKKGETKWKCAVPQKDKAAYSSIIAAELAGQKQYVQFLARGLVGISTEGEFLWRFDAPANSTANCATPICFDDCAFATSAYGKAVGALAKISKDGKKFDAQEVFTCKGLRNHHGGVVLVDGFLYGANGGNEKPHELVCVDAKKGTVAWKNQEVAKGAIAWADGRLYYRNEGGTMYLLEANPKEFVEVSKFDPADRSKQPSWCHPVIANGKLYLRDQDVLHCYDIKKKE